MLEQIKRDAYSQATEGSLTPENPQETVDMSQDTITVEETKCLAM